MIINAKLKSPSWTGLMIFDFDIIGETDRNCWIVGIII